MEPYILEYRKISVDEYLDVRGTTLWKQVSTEQVERALTNDLFSVCVTHHNQLVAIGRMIGDGGLYCYIQDVIVKPGHQHKGLGKQIMQAIDQYIETQLMPGTFIGLMAAEGTEEFYRLFGFKTRSDSSPGMYKYRKP